MARINTNVSSVIAQANLRRSSVELDTRLERLSTGLRINRGKDDPAGMIISQRIASDIAGIEQGIRNGERASSVIATTEAALTEVGDLLNSIKGLLIEAANTGANSRTEREANQLQIDSAIDSITRIASTATFGGLKLVDGSLDYVTSGIIASNISQARIFGASLAGVSALQVEVDVVASAQQGAVFLDPRDNGGTIQSTATIRITGVRGSQQLTFPSNTSYSDIVQAVNNITGRTGITAELINGNPASGVAFRSEGYGTDAFVSVQRIGGPPAASDPLQTRKYSGDAPVEDPFDWSNGDLVTGGRDEGRDVVALINGSLANGRGLITSINSPTLSVELLLSPNYATLPDAAPDSFYITGGGGTFQLGPQITVDQQVNVGVPSVAASQLGGTLIDGTVQFLASLKSGNENDINTSVRNGDWTAAEDILATAIDEIAVLRGRLGALERNVLEPNGRSLQSAFENLTASRSQIRDADFAFETSRLTRAQILNSSSTQILTIANSQAQNVLQLLG